MPALRSPEYVRRRWPDRVQRWYDRARLTSGRARACLQRLVSNNTTGAITQSPTATNNCELPTPIMQPCQLQKIDLLQVAKSKTTA